MEYCSMKDPSKRLISIFIIIILVLIGTIGCINNNDDDDDKREGFSIDSISNTVPEVFDLPNPTYEPSPHINTTIPKSVPNIIAIWFFEKNTAYRDFGGTINLFIKNNSTQQIFVYKIGIKLKFSRNNRLIPDKLVHSNAGRSIAPGQEEQVGLIYFTGPTQTGEYEYNILFSLYLQNETGAWNDCGQQESSEKKLKFEEPEGTMEYDQHYNLPQYYDKIRSVVDPTYHEVVNLSRELAGGYPGKFNIYQACAVFDYVHEDVKYFSDPTSTTNYWCTPEQTLKFGGDCEDHSTLIGSMLISVGGSVRIYMTDSHAFLALYIGNTSNLDDVLEGIRSYYRTNVNIFYFSDELGNWLIVDSIGSIYLGGLPLGAVPVLNTSSGMGISWGFSETENLYVTDIIP
jgi:transglutaminase-like putative cysteine protease